MKPDIWGPPAWKFLDAICLNYPQNPSNTDKEAMKDFINALEKVLPCTKCKVNFKDHLNRRPLTDQVLSSRNELIKWLIDIRNMVNIMNGKKIVPYESALHNMLSPYNISYTKYILFVFVIIIILLYYIIRH
jgi:hypothetical protein